MEFHSMLLVIALSSMDIILKLFTGAIGVYAIQAVKKVLSFSGRYAVLVSVIISALLALGLMWVTGEITTLKFTNTNELVSTAAQVFAVATVAYQFIKKAELIPAVLQPKPDAQTKA